MHQAVASASGQSLDEGAEEAKRKLPRNRPSAVANFILDQFLPLGLLLAMVVGCAARQPTACTSLHGSTPASGKPLRHRRACWDGEGVIAARQPPANSAGYP